MTAPSQLIEISLLMLWVRSWNPQKTVIEGETRVGPMSLFRGFVEDFGHRTEDVLWIQGELHDFRIPVSSLAELVNYAR